MNAGESERDDADLAVDIAALRATVASRLAAAGVAAAPETEAALAASEFLLAAWVADPVLRDAPWQLDAEPFAGIESLDEEAAIVALLRQRRRRALARIALRDIGGQSSTQATLESLSSLADAAIQAALAAAERLLLARFGRARYADQQPMPLVVVGMGKLGGGELNFSSDIDLIFLYPDGGETDGRRPTDHFEYYTRLGQKLIQLLDAPTVDGFVYRVDMRLRPFGDSGPLVSSFAALEDYLLHHGRDWERYAWVKARAVTGQAAYADLFEQVVRPFVYRRYLDFGVFEALRDMKALIEREVARRELNDHVKLGRGGIREVEFVVQALQLVRGGGDARLRSASLLAVLPRLAGQKLLTAAQVEQLRAAYLALRHLENRLQMVADEQIHTLPTERSRRARLACGDGVARWSDVLQPLDAARQVVTDLFDTLVLAGTSRPDARHATLRAQLLAATELADIAAVLAPHFGAEHLAMAERLHALRASAYGRRLDVTGRARLESFLGRLLEAIGEVAQPDAVLRRALAIAEAIGPRTAYLALINENPLVMHRLVEVCQGGNYLAAQIASHPLLLDELIDPALFDAPPSRPEIAEQLRLRLEDCGNDAEHIIAALREVQRAAIFRIALWDLSGRLPLMQVSDRLTDVAELILQNAMDLAWQELVALYGEPTAGAGNDSRVCKVIAVGYGKLGGRELGYGSDLDLVFLHDSAGDDQQTRGPKVIDNQVFFLRLGQKIVHLLTVHTAAGRLYEVDMRLRPSGKGGLLMTQMDAFVRYQREEAWTWEHQALLHSRAVAGDAALQQQFEAARLDILTHSVHRDRLRADVHSMRERMRRELSRAAEGQFDLKQDPGGLADIEFLAQYWVLAHAERWPALVHYPDTIRALESLGSGALVDHALIDRLVDTYQAYRLQIHRRALEGAGRVVPAAAVTGLAEPVAAIWTSVMVDRTDGDGGPSSL